MRQNERVPGGSEAGFTIIEGLVAALILAVILIGILPMITRSMQNNLQGNDATNESNAVMDQLDELYSLPFHHPYLIVPTGTTSLTAIDYYRLSSNVWETTVDASDTQYTRTVVAEYFGGNDLRDDGKLDTPLPGESPAGTVQLIRLSIDIQKQRALGATPYRATLLKAY